MFCLMFHVFSHSHMYVYNIDYSPLGVAQCAIPVGVSRHGINTADILQILQLRTDVHRREGPCAIQTGQNVG